MVCANSFWERACETASEGTQRRFIETTQLYVDAICRQVVNRRHDEIPTIETFVKLRRDTSAVKLVFALVEYSLNLDLPDEVFEDPMIQSLEEGANDILTWANDMYSFNVEQSKGDTQNLVVIAMNELGLDVQGAVDYVGDMIRQRIDQYVMEKHCVPSWGEEVDAQVAKYVEGLEDWVIGVLHWSFDSERYFGAEHERIKRDRIVTLLPVDTSMLPAPDSTVVEDDVPADELFQEEKQAAPAPSPMIVADEKPTSPSWSSLLPSSTSPYLTLATVLFPPVLAISLRYFDLC